MNQYLNFVDIVEEEQIPFLSMKGLLKLSPSYHTVQTMTASVQEKAAQATAQAATPTPTPAPVPVPAPASPAQPAQTSVPAPAPKAKSKTSTYILAGGLSLMVLTTAILIIKKSKQ
jgi:hypothetical protein